MGILHHLLLTLPFATIPAFAIAECGNLPPPPRGEMKAPPPPFDTRLCKDKAAGTVIETTDHDGRTLKGTCQVVFLPERPPAEGKTR